jgi:hypothetical protein
MLSFLYVDMFRINCFIKTQVPQSFLHLQHTGHQLPQDGFSNCVTILALDFNTPVSWARRFHGFLAVCSSLAPMSSNFSSVSTRSLCFSFLPIRSPVVLSLFTKLWIVCLIGTLSSQNLRRNFRRHFLVDPYFTWVSYRNTRCSKAYRTMVPHCSLKETENKQLMELITAAYCWQIINILPRMNCTTRSVI